MSEASMTAEEADYIFEAQPIRLHIDEDSFEKTVDALWVMNEHAPNIWKDKATLLDTLKSTAHEKYLKSLWVRTCGAVIYFYVHQDRAFSAFACVSPQLAAEYVKKTS